MVYWFQSKLVEVQVKTFYSLNCKTVPSTDRDVLETSFIYLWGVRFRIKMIEVGKSRLFA